MLVARDGEGAAAYVPGTLWFERAEGSGAPDSFVRTETSVLTVSREADAYVLRENGIERVRSDAALAAPSQAPYTKAIAYAVRFHEPEERAGIPAHVPVVSPGEWEVHLYLPQTGTTERVVSGYAPLFVDDTHFLFFTSGGIYRYDLATGAAEQVLARAFPLLVSPVLQSPNRNLVVVRDVAANTTTVYQVNGSELVPARVIDQLLPAPALSADALYDLRGTGSGTGVWKYGLAGGEPVLTHTFPAALPIIRLIY